MQRSDYIRGTPQTARAPKATMTALPVTISDRAARRIADILKAEAQPIALRLAVTGGGCSGFQYNFALDDAQLDEDTVVEKAGAKVLIDPVSLDFRSIVSARLSRSTIPTLLPPAAAAPALPSNENSHLERQFHQGTAGTGF